MRCFVGMASGAFALTLLLSPAHALAAEGTPIGDAMGVLLIPLAIGTVVPVGADVYFTVKDVGQVWLGKQPSAGSAKNELYWTFWQPALLVPLALGGFAVAVGNDDTTSSSWEHDQLSATLLAFSAWPLSLAAHGFWYGEDGHRWAPVTALAVGDGLLLGYDIMRQAVDERFRSEYITLEIAIGAGQLLYGLGATARAQGAERWRDLAVLGVPALLVAHGAMAIAEVPFPNRIRIASMPTMFAEPIPGGMMLTLGDRW